MKFTFAPESKPLEGYTIKRAIYRGGFGEVYYALSDAGREVALKLLQNNTEVELRGVQQCLNLSHPNLVTIFDIRRDGDGDHWIVMEFVSGETLDAAIRRYPGGMPMEEIRRWLPGISEGVAFLHDNGLVHRDLKPANIFSDTGCVKVGDVGLSKFITHSRRSAQTQSVGTVYYMAPEVAKGKYGKEVDVYALGVILFEMLTGKVPFDGDSTGEILMKHLTEKPNLNRLPIRLQPVVAKALEKDPAQRFSSPRALVSAFDAAVLGRPFAEEAAPRKEAGGDRHRPDEAAANSFRKGPNTNGLSDKKPTFVFWPNRTDDNYARSGMTWLAASLICLITPLAGFSPAMFVLAMLFGVYGLVRMTFRLGNNLLGEPCTPTPGIAENIARGLGRHPDQRPVTARSVAGDVALACYGLTGNSQASALTRWTHWMGTAVACAVLMVVGTMAVELVSQRYASGSLFGLTGTGGLPGRWTGWASFVLTGIAAAWAITASCKYWEGRSPTGMALRGTLWLAGLVVGAFGGGLSRYLEYNASTAPDVIGKGGLFPQLSHGPQPPMSDLMRDTVGNIPGFDHGIVGWMLVMGCLFAFRNWSRQADEFRPRRFRISSLAMTVLVAWGSMLVVGVESKVFLIWAGVVSAAVQIASVWTPTGSRKSSC